MPLTPKNRKEEWLQGLVDHETTLTPKNRPEEWMKEIIDASGSGGGGGTGGGVLVVNVSFGESTMTLDKTWQQIHDGQLVGVVTAVIISEENMEVSSIFVSNCAYDTETSKYLVNLYESGAPQFAANSPNDYPVAQIG